MTITGDQVTLRPVAPEDIDSLVTIFAEPAIAEWWPGYDRTRITDEFLDDDDPDTSIYIIELDGEVTGIIQCYEESDPEYKSASIDIAVGTRWHGAGLAVDALQTLIRDLVDRRGHHHITIDPAVENGRAIACYKKVGFKPVGVLRQNEKGADGTFHDALLMDLLADDLRLSPPATP
jgi:aminoglycoside 6'-N-acetyltransferase